MGTAAALPTASANSARTKPGIGRIGAGVARSRAPGRVLALFGTMVVALAAAGSTLAGGVNGTWTGRLIIPQEIGNIPTSAYPTAKLVVGPATVSATFHGRTQAAHDPESATSTCTMRLRFRAALSSDGWRVYENVGKPTLAGSVSGGPPDMSPCFYWSTDGKSRVLLRVRPAGNKLKAEFGEFEGREPVFGAGYLRGYLHH